MNAHNDNNNKPKPDASNADDVRSRQLDNEFADLTDALLEGREIRLSDELRDLSITARQLQALFSDENLPSAEFRGRLSRRLDIAWNGRRHKQRGLRLLFGSNRVRQFSALAAALVLLLAVAILLGLGKSAETVMPGTAIGILSPTFILVAGLFVVAIIGFGLWRRK